MPKNYRYTLIDIGLVINQLMGSGFRFDRNRDCDRFPGLLNDLFSFRSTYTRRKFRYRYEYSNGCSPGQHHKGKHQNNGGFGAAREGSGKSNPRSRMLKKTNTEISFKVGRD